MEQRITALKVQKRNPNRVNVYLNGEYAFGLARIVAAWLAIGEDLTEEKKARLLQEDTCEVALQKALNLLSYRPRSEQEIEKRLFEQGYTEVVVREVLERLRRGQVIDDGRFAQQWVENRSAFRPRSHRMLSMELRQKGVSREVIDQTLSEAEDDQDLAHQAAKRYARRLEGLDWPTFRQRLTGFLGRRGFSYSTVDEAVRKAWQERVEPSESEH